MTRTATRMERFAREGACFHEIADFVRLLIRIGVCPWLIGVDEYRAIGRLADEWVGNEPRQS